MAEQCSSALAARPPTLNLTSAMAVDPSLGMVIAQEGGEWRSTSQPVF